MKTPWLGTVFFSWMLACSALTGGVAGADRTDSPSPKPNQTGASPANSAVETTPLVEKLKSIVREQMPLVQASPVPQPTPASLSLQTPPPVSPTYVVPVGETPPALAERG